MAVEILASDYDRKSGMLASARARKGGPQIPGYFAFHLESIGEERQRPIKRALHLRIARSHEVKGVTPFGIAHELVYHTVSGELLGHEH